MSTAREILTSEDIDAQAQLLLSLLSDAAAGRDLFGVATDVIQVVLASGAGTAYTKKLAYDLCKLVPLSESDCDLLLIGIKTDVGSPFPDTQMAALQFLPSLPGSQLFAFLDRGQVSSLVEPCLYSGTPEVRSAAAITLARILLNSEVLSAAAASHGMTSTFQDWWELLSDGLVDPSTRAVGGAVAAVNLLLAAADRCRDAGVKEPPQVLVVKLATRVGEGIAAGLGPALLQFRDLSPGLQVEVAELLVHLGKQAVREGGGGGAEVTLASVGQHLVGCCGSINPAVRMEAAKGLLSLTRSLRLAPPVGNSLGPPPPVWATSAVAGLLGLKDRQYVEAALNDIVGTVAEHLEELQVGARTGVVKRLMPMVGALPGLQSRVTALVLLWEGLLQLHTATMQARARGDAPSGAPTLTSFLADPSIKDLLAGVQAPAGFSAPPTPDHPPTDTTPKQELKRALSLDMFRSQSSTTPSSLPSPSTPMMDSKPQLPLTFKHEVTCTLLCVLASHPSALAAASLAPRVLEDGPAAATREVAWREAQAAAVHWLSAATAALSATTACVSWEPYISAASFEQMSSQSSSQAAPPAWLLVNFTSVPSDAWLKLQATAAHVLRALLRSLGHPSMPSLLRANQGRTLDRLHPADNGSLAKAFRDASVSLQASVKKLLTDWEELALTVRPRVLWVAAYSLELPALLDDTWKRVVGALESLLLVGPLALPETHLKDLAVASMAGCLYPSVIGPSDMQVASSGGLAGALARAAQMTSPSPRGGGGADHLGMLQLAELAETSMDGLQVGLQVLQQLVYLLDDALHTPDVASGSLMPPAPVLAAKLQLLTRRLILAPTVTPDIRNVCRRLLKTLSAFDDLDLPQSAQPPQTAPDTDPDTPTSSTPSPTKSLAPLAPTNGISEPPPALGPTTGVLLGSTAAMQRPWGYPFCPPRSAVMSSGARHKRETDMVQVLEAATSRMAARHASQQDKAGEEMGPVLGATGGPRLDDPTFWRDLEGGAVGVEINGPSDPLVLTASYQLQQQDPTNLEVCLKAFNRLDVDVEGVEVHVRLVGAMLTERRGASWHIPKLVPYEAARHQFVLKMIGFSRMEVHCKVQLPVGRVGDPIAPVLNCEPFSIPLSSLLHSPSPPPSPQAFFSNWQTLPLSTHLSALCAWSGVEGMLLVLSVLERQPLRRMWLRTLPALSSCQAAYATLTTANEPVALVVTMQLMPADDGTMAGSITSARAAVEMTVRSTSHEVVSTIEQHPPQWASDISQGSLTHGLRTPPSAPPSCKPALHPDIAPLLHLYSKSTPLTKLATSMTAAAAQLKRLTMEQDPLMLEPELDDTPDEVAQGNWVRSTALSEWRRMCVAV